MDLDPVSVRDILKKIPGLSLVEMAHHGANTLCCGNFSMARYPELMVKVMDNRLQEAEDTGADLMLNVCHACNNLFSKEEPKHNFEIVNYISLLADALNIERKDRYNEYRQWGNPERIMEDAREFVTQSSYTHDEIIEAIKNNFT
jgi:Fe-S oxidoreductase